MGYVFAELQDPKSAVQCWENARRAFTAAGYPNDAAQMSELIAKYA
jgi:hypothetical protein